MHDDTRIRDTVLAIIGLFIGLGLAYLLQAIGE